MANNPANVPAVPDVSSLRVIPVAAGTDYGTIYLEGYYTSGDGGGGLWTWSPSSSATDNTGTVINPTGNSGNGRWLRVFDGPLHDLWFGVKADGSTDNIMALQAVENAANDLGLDIYYPWQSNTREFSTTITTYSGVRHIGDGANLLANTSGGFTGLSGSVLYCTSGSNIPAFKYQASTGVVVSLPAPSFQDLNINANGGGILELNSSTGGFTDDLTSQATQSDLIFQNVVMNIDNGTATALALYKCFNSKIEGCFINNSGYQIYLEGSDNTEITRNNLENAGVYSVYGINAGTTFGNMLWLRDNIFLAMSPGATGVVYSTYRSTYIEDNFFEPNLTLSLGVIVLDTGGLNAHVIGNEISVIGSTPSWLVVNGTWANLKIDSNFRAGSTLPAASFNSGAGHKAYYNISAQANITGNGTVGGSLGIPFLLIPPQPTGASVDQPPAASGSVYWNFNPNISPLDGSAGSYYLSVMVAPGGFYALPPGSGTTNKIGWSGPYYSITDTVDVWVFGLTISGSTTTLSATFNNTGTVYTQAIPVTANPVWYKIASAVSVTSVSSLQVYNADTTNNGTIYLGSVKVVKH